MEDVGRLVVGFVNSGQLRKQTGCGGIGTRVQLGTRNCLPLSAVFSFESLHPRPTPRAVGTVPIEYIMSLFRRVETNEETQSNVLANESSSRESAPSLTGHRSPVTTRLYVEGADSNPDTKLLSQRSGSSPTVYRACCWRRDLILFSLPRATTSTTMSKAEEQCLPSHTHIPAPQTTKRNNRFWLLTALAGVLIFVVNFRGVLKTTSWKPYMGCRKDHSHTPPKSHYTLPSGDKIPSVALGEPTPRSHTVHCFD